MGYKHLFLAIIAFGCLLCRAQPSSQNHELITTGQGLPHNTVLCLLQDSEGTIWIGTYNGLCEYSGNRMTVHKNVFDTTTSANWFHAIETLFEDSRKNIWIGSRGGIVSCYIRETQSFQVYPQLNPRFVKVNCFFEDDKGRIWLGETSGRLVRVYPDIVAARISEKPVLAIGQCYSDTLLALTTEKVLRYTISKDLVTTGPGEGALSNVLLGYSMDENMVAQQDKSFSLVDICKGTIGKKTMLFSNLSSTLPGRLLFTKDDRYYYTDGLRIGEYSMNGSMLDSFIISDNECYNPDLVLNCMIEDNSGILWMGTNSGLYKINRNKYRFRKYTQNNISGRISDNYVRAIHTDKQDDIWVGYKSGKINKLRYDPAQRQYVLSDVYSVGVTSHAETINSFCFLENGQVLAGGEAGLFILNSDSRQFIRYMPDVIPNSVVEVWALHRDASGNIWIGTHQNGLYVVTPSAKEIYHYTLDDSSGLPGNAIWAIYEDIAGDVWIGTENGLYKTVYPYHVSHLKFNNFPLGGKRNVPVWSIVNDKEGDLWIGSTGYGIFRLRNNSKECISYGNRPENVISSIIPDNNGDMWVGTVNGLYRYLYKSGEFIRYDETDGLVSSDFNFKAVAKSKTGLLFFGSKMGMISFDPQQVGMNFIVPPPVHITSITAAGKKIQYSPHTNKPLELTYKQNFINIGLSIPEYSKPDKHRYRYQLKDFDPSWNYTDNKNPQAVYTNIPPGEYRFVVQGSADGIHWGDEDNLLLINITPAIWQRRVFHLMAVVLLILFASLIVYWRVRKRIHEERTRHSVEKRMAELELNALQTQMNPHFIFNTISSIQHFVLNNDEITAYTYLTKFSRLMRLFLESSKNRFISLEMETELLELYLSLEKLRYEDRIDYRLSVDSTLNLKEIYIPPMLLQPFVENAIKHGLANKDSNGFLDVNVSLRKDDPTFLHCVIEDNGIGREKAALLKSLKKSEHISRGMDMVAERIKTYNFISGKSVELRIIDKAHPEVGTRVEIFIPVSRYQ